MPSPATWCASAACRSHDFIYPVFVHEGENRREAVPSMPGVERLSPRFAAGRGRGLRDAGHPLHGAVPGHRPQPQDPDGQEAANPNGLIPRVVRALKKEFPELGVMTDVALDPYTSHGQDGMLGRDRLHPQRRHRGRCWRPRRWRRPKPVWTWSRPAT